MSQKQYLWHPTCHILCSIGEANLCNCILIHPPEQNTLHTPPFHPPWSAKQPHITSLTSDGTHDSSGILNAWVGVISSWSCWSDCNPPGGLHLRLVFILPPNLNFWEPSSVAQMEERKHAWHYYLFSQRIDLLKFEFHMACNDL